MNSSITDADERVRTVDFSDSEIHVELMDGRRISAPLDWYPRLASATALQRNSWKICGAGYGIHWSVLDEDLSTEGLLRQQPSPEFTARNTRS